MIQYTCHCGSQKNYISCCAPLLSGVLPATTAESLMRSRYTAYVVKNEAYLLQTWHKSTRPKNIALEDPIQWVSLEIKETVAGGPDDEAGIVEYVAHYKSEGVSQQLAERSKFIKEKGRWFYVDGDVPLRAMQPTPTSKATAKPQAKSKSARR